MIECNANRDIIDIINSSCQSNTYYLDCANGDDLTQLDEMINNTEDCHKINVLHPLNGNFVLVKTKQGEVASYIMYEQYDDAIYISYSCTSGIEKVEKSQIEKLRPYFRNVLVENVLNDSDFDGNIDDIEFTDSEVDKFISELDSIVVIKSNIHRRRDLSTILRVFILMVAMKNNVKHVISNAISPYSSKALTTLGFKYDILEGVDIDHNMVFTVNKKSYDDTIKKLKLCS